MRHRPLAGGILVAVVVPLLLAGPAQAAPTGGFTSPANGDCGTQRLAGGVPALQGGFGPGALTGRIVEAALVLDSARANATVASASWTRSGGGDPAFSSDNSSVSFDWRPSSRFNGPHVARATALERDLLGSTYPAEDTRSFCLAVPPSTPRNVVASPDAGRSAVTVRWNANTEGDLVGYQVLRAPKGSAELTDLGVTTATSFTDSAVPANGDWQYEVRAARYGVSNLERDVLLSPGAKAATSVTYVTTTTAPPTTAAGGGDTGAAPGAGTSGGAGAAPATGSPGPGSTTTAGQGGGGSSGGALAPSFRSLLDQNQRAAPRRAPAPDTGFDPLLPFNVPEGGLDPANQPSDEELGAGEEDAEEAAAPATGELLDQSTIGDTDDERRRSLSFLAGGLLTFVMLMQVLWIKGEVKRAPLDLETEPVEPGDGDATAAAALIPPPGPKGSRKGRRPAKAHSRSRANEGAKVAAGPTEASASEGARATAAADVDDWLAFLADETPPATSAGSRQGHADGAGRNGDGAGTGHADGAGRNGDGASRNGDGGHVRVRRSGRNGGVGPAGSGRVHDDLAEVFAPPPEESTPEGPPRVLAMPARPTPADAAPETASEPARVLAMPAAPAPAAEAGPDRVVAMPSAPEPAGARRGRDRSAANTPAKEGSSRARRASRRVPPRPEGD